MPLSFDPAWTLHSGSVALSLGGTPFQIGGWGGGPGGEEIVWFFLLENFGLAPVEMTVARQTDTLFATEPLDFLQIDLPAGAHLFVIHGTRVDNLSSITCVIRGDNVHRYCWAASATFRPGNYTEAANEALTGTSDSVTATRARVHAAVAVKSDAAPPTDYPTISSDGDDDGASIGTPPLGPGEPSQFQMSVTAHEGSNVFAITALDQLRWFYALGAGGRQWWTGVMGSSGG